MDNKSINYKRVALYLAVGVGAISVLGGVTFFARKLWNRQKSSSPSLTIQVSTDDKEDKPIETEMIPLSKKDDKESDTYEPSDLNLSLSE